MRFIKTLLILKFVICDRVVFSKPVTVPTNYDNEIFNRYSYQNYIDEDTTRNKPNAFFNRLPQNGYQAHVDSIQNDATDDDDIDYDEHLTDKPAPSAQYQQQQQQNLQKPQFDVNSNYLYNENRIKKKKKKRRIKRPCIPIQSYNSPLFSNNRLKREHKNDDEDREREGGKTLGLLGLLGGGYGGYGNNFYQPPYGGYYRPSYDAFNQRPQYDAPLYNPTGGYPCIPTNFGQNQGFGGGGGYFGGGNFGNLGNFGNYGGSLDVDNNQNDYQGPANYPQTVIINRPPLFGGFPNNQNNNNNFNRPQNTQNNPLNNNFNYNQNQNQNPFNRPPLTSSGKPLWEGIVDRVQEFVRHL